MRTKEIKLYMFDELDEQAQAKAIQDNASINFDCCYNWWDFTYGELRETPQDVLREDAFPFVTSITVHAFDIEHGRCDLDVTLEACDLFDWLINTAFGDEGKTARRHRNMLTRLLDTGYIEHRKDTTEFVVEWGSEVAPRLARLLSTCFDYEDIIRQIKEDVLTTLRAEYEYLSSDEAIIENIRANDMEFTANGTTWTLQE